MLLKLKVIVYREKIIKILDSRKSWTFILTVINNYSKEDQNTSLTTEYAFKKEFFAISAT